MKRRDFLKSAGVAATGVAAASALAAPAIASDTIKWKMVTSWPKNLPGPGVAAQMLADRITMLSRNVSTTLRQWHLDFKLDFLSLALVD